MPNLRVVALFLFLHFEHCPGQNIHELSNRNCVCRYIFLSRSVVHANFFVLPCFGVVCVVHFYTSNIVRTITLKLQHAHNFSLHKFWVIALSFILMCYVHNVTPKVCNLLTLNLTIYINAKFGKHLFTVSKTYSGRIARFDRLF